MSDYKIRFQNGEVLVVSYDVDDFVQCNICGQKFEPAVAIPWSPDSEGNAVPSHCTCPECETEWGFDDLPLANSPVGSASDLWMKLRLAHLDDVGWSDELVKRIEENLDITRAELEAARDVRERLK